MVARRVFNIFAFYQIIEPLSNSFYVGKKGGHFFGYVRGEALEEKEELSIFFEGCLGPICRSANKRVINPGRFMVEQAAPPMEVNGNAFLAKLGENFFRGVLSHPPVGKNAYIDAPLFSFDKGGGNLGVGEGINSDIDPFLCLVDRID